MIYQQETVIPGNTEFNAVLDETCERLWDTKIRHSLRRIGELDALLDTVEKELTALTSSEFPAY